MASPVAAVHPSVSKAPIPLDAKDLPTVCVLCSHNCGLRVDVEGGRIVKVRADESNPITHGYICNKGFSVAHYAHHEQRLEHPLKRQPDGSFERVSWDDAIAEIGERLRAIHQQHGPRAIGLVGIGGQANHMDAPFGIHWLAAMGSLRWFNAFAQEKHQHFLIDQWMFDSSPSAWFHADNAHAELLLVMGTNPRVSNRGHAPNETFRALVEDPNRRMIVVDPRETETSRGADRHVRVKPGTDAWFLLGVAATIASGEGLANARFLAERTIGFEALREALAAVDVDEMARRCDVPADEIRAVAQEFASAGSASVFWDLAVEQTAFSTLISYLIRVLAVLTGNVGNAGGMIFMETMSPPERDPRRFEEPERTLAAGIRGISAIGGFPMFSPTLVPEEIQVDHPERLRALVVEGANPYLSYSDTSRWREARERLELLVTIEPAMTETARQSDFVLPTPCGYEKWEVAGFPKGFPDVATQVRPPVIPAPPDALPEAEIYARITEAMGLIGDPPPALFELAKNALVSPEGLAAWFGTLSSEANGHAPSVLYWAYRTLGPELPSPVLVAVLAQCLQNAAGRRESVLRTLGPDFAAASPFEIALELFRRILDHPEGVEIARLDADKVLDANVGYEDGRIRLAPEEMLAEIARAAAAKPVSDPNYPFVLAAGIRTQWTANTIHRDPAWRKGRGPHCALHLAPADAEQLGIAEGDRVRLRTRRGAVELPAALDKRCRQGHVWVPNGFGMSYPDENGVLRQQGVNLNELTDATERDPISGCPHTKVTLCAVEPVATPAAA